MIDFFIILESLDNYLWGYAAVPAIMALGIYLSFLSRLAQIRHFPTAITTFFSFFKTRNTGEVGIHPLKAFFASLGGCTGIGNIVAICTAVQLGGPGALLWIWAAALIGMMIKYSEIYLGIKYRVANGKGGFHGGPMYFLRKAFNNRWVPFIVCFLLCIYGVEVYQFSVVTNSLSSNLALDKSIIVGALLILIIGAAMGGIKRIGQISSTLVPLFMVCYVGMGAWVLFQNFQFIPEMMTTIVKSAFTGHAAVGGFAGSGLLFTVSQGIRRGCYSGDLGVGYASVIHSESGEVSPEKQASLAIIDIFVDSFLICSTSVMLVLVTGAWKAPLDGSLLVQTALTNYFPYMDIFIPLFLFLLGYTTIIAYFCTGIKCAEFLSPKHGKKIYYAYAIPALAFFSFYDTSHALIVMSITGGLLLLINLYGIFKLRHEISFSMEIA